MKRRSSSSSEEETDYLRGEPATASTLGAQGMRAGLGFGRGAPLSAARGIATPAECCGFEMEGRPQPQERDGMASRRGQEERERDGEKGEERERGAPAFMRRNETGAATEQQRDGEPQRCGGSTRPV